MQVDPIKPTLKASGTKRLKLNYDKLLSSFAVNFNLRRYTVEGGRPLMKSLHVGGNARMSGDVAVVLASVPNVEHLDVAGTAMTAASSAAAAAAITSAAHLTNYHVGGAAFVPVLGRAAQVDPIKPLLKAPGNKRLKLKYHEPLLSFAFKFNLRRYSSVLSRTPPPPHSLTSSR